MASSSAIATLAMFIFLNLFFSRPLSFQIFLPYLGRRRLHISFTTASIITILILWVTKCLGPHEIRDGIVGTDGIKPYNVVILFFSLAYMAITLDITGILKSAAFWVSNKGSSNGRKLFLYLYLLSTVISIFLGNNPLILTVFLVYYTKVNELDPIAWLMSDLTAANIASMVLFVGNPTNVIICEGFQVNAAAFTAYTILPFLACSLTSFIALAIQFRTRTYIPLPQDVRGNLGVRAVLLDPVGACVGGTMLGLCLIIIIVVSQVYKVEVWMIGLSCAFGQFLWDLGWDTYRSATGMLEAKNKNYDMDEEIYHAMLRQFNTHATVNMDEFETEPENAVSNLFAAPRAALNTVLGSTFTTVFQRTHPSLQALSIQARADLHSNPLNTPTSHQNLQLLSFIPNLSIYLSSRFPIIYTALPRLPFALVPFTFSQFILIEGLSHQGWIDVFANWLVILTKREMFKTVWVVGSFGMLWCNTSGTDIGATILLTKIVRAAASSYVPPSSGPEVNMQAFLRSAAIALAVASNIGAAPFASLAGLTWGKIRIQNRIYIRAKENLWYMFSLMVRTAVGLAVISAEMAVLY